MIEENFQDNLLKAYLYAVDSNQTNENLKKAITTGPYGKYVYKCDNNVADHMVCILEFENKCSEEQEEIIDKEMNRLGVVAIGMYNRQKLLFDLGS